MTTEEQYVAALMLAELSDNEAQRDAYVDMSVAMALHCDWEWEQRIALREAAGVALGMLHPEVPLEVVVRLAIKELSPCGEEAY